MLGSDVLSVRLGGIYALQSLAEERPRQYCVQNMRLLCMFVRHPTKHEDVEVEGDGADIEGQSVTLRPRPREDVQAIMLMMRNRNEVSYCAGKGR